MSLFKEKILECMDDCMKIRQTKEYIENQKLLDECMNKLSEYLKEYPDKEFIEDLVADILIAENRVNESLRYFDFYSAFLIGLNVGRESNNQKYDKLISSINELVSFVEKH
ncbi:MAG: hypothetical protein ACI4SR_10480 [Faecalibacillus sp.]